MTTLQDGITLDAELAKSAAELVALIHESIDARWDSERTVRVIADYVDEIQAMSGSRLAIDACVYALEFLREELLKKA